MSDPEIPGGLQTLKDLIDLPSWAVTALTLLITARLLYRPLSEIVGSVYRVVVNYIIPVTYSSEKRLRVQDRKIFADYVEGEIRRYNAREDWSDHRFAELEAEVEVQDSNWGLGVLSYILPTGAVRREKSLTRALRHSIDRQVLLVGDPGSGKSVALRHLAQSVAQKAMRSRRLNSTIPIYVNLRELPARPDTVTADSIRTFILTSINRANDRDIARFLIDSFDDEAKGGRWLFLFDSFDEIPELLSSTEMDEVVQRYADAIYYFLRSMKRSRGIIASREYRSPKTFGSARFRILPLSDSRKKDLIRRARLKRAAKRDLLVGIQETDPALKQMSDNPLFLSLLVEYMRSGSPFPDSSHVVFEKYIETRLQRDNALLAERFAVSPIDMRRVAAELAYCMVVDRSLGLSPSWDGLQKAMERLNLSTYEQVTVAMEALVFIKLARVEEAHGNGRTFTFAHRRFQEYFATCFVIKEPHRVTPADLLKDGRWRETAVTICQTQTQEAISALLTEAETFLDDALDRLGVRAGDLEIESTKADLGLPNEGKAVFFWPPGVLHVLGVINSGFASSDTKLTPSIRKKAGLLLMEAGFRGRPHDCRWALEVVGTSPKEVFLWFVRSAFRSGSSWLREVAFRQIGSLNAIPVDLAKDIRRTLVTLSVGGRLRTQSLSVAAQLKRIEHPHKFLATERLLLAIPWVDGGIQAFLFLYIFTFSILSTWERVIVLALACASMAFTYCMRATTPLVWPHSFFKPALWLGSRNNTSHSRLAAILTCVFGCVRIFLLLVAVVGITTILSGGFDILTLVFTIGLAWVVLWSPCALIAARRGRFVELWWWPFLPMMAPPFLLLWVIRVIFRRRTGRFIMQLARFAALAAALSVIYRGVDALIRKLDIPSFVSLDELSLLGVSADNLAFWAALLICLASPMIALYRWVHTWILLHRWMRSTPEDLSGEQLLEQVQKMRTTGQLLRLLQTVRTKWIIAQGSEAHKAINDLFIASEHMRRIERNYEEARAQWSRWQRVYGFVRFDDVAGWGMMRTLRGAWRDRAGWPEFSTTYFPDWLDRNSGEYRRYRLLLTDIDVIDEMSRIVDDLEGTPAGQFSAINVQSASARDS